MTIKQLLAGAKFSTSAARPSDLPADNGCEIAFAGRSNAGKSSVLNKLCARKQLARTSKTPGRTQLINFFVVSPSNRLIDLPGYGYAKANNSKQRQWTELLEYYFIHRQSLRGTMLIMDIRHPLQEADQAMLDWCIHCRCDVHILLNKADKMSRNQAHKQLQLMDRQLAKQANSSISYQLFSAHSGEGLDMAYAKIGAWFEVE